ncbi:TPA: hypothetical protein SB288_001761 [Campylobacter coli]|nr:hypothetical protein [Campylobacter coli]
MGIIKSTARGIRGTYRAGKNAVNGVNSAYNSAVSGINKVNSALDPMNIVRSTSQRLNNWMDSSSKVSKSTQKNNDVIVNELNNVGNEVISATKALDPMNARKLTEISESLKNLSKQISDIKKGLIDNQDTEIRHQGFDKKVQNVSESKVNTPQNKSFFDKLLGWLGGLLGISTAALLPLLGSLGSFLSKPLDFILDLLKGGINKLWTLFEPLLGPIIDPLKNGFEFLKNKWNSLVDFINKKFNIGDKWKISDNDNPKNPKSPSVKSLNTKEQSWLSKKWDSFKGAMQNGYDWSSRKIDDLKSYASKKYQDIKNSKVGKIISAGYDKLKAAQKYIVEKAIEGFDTVKNIVSSAWDSAVKAAQKGFNMLKKFVLAPIEKFVSSVGKKLFGSSKLFSVLPSILGNLEKIGARLAASGAKIASKALPGVGFAVGIYQAWDFFTRGRWVLGSIAALSACISLLPGIGGIISMCLDLGLFAADIITSPEDVDSLNKEQNDLVNTANKMVQNNDTGGISEPSQVEKDKAQSGVQDSSYSSSSGSSAKGLNAKVLDGKSANDFAALYTPHKVDANGTVIAAKTGSIYKGLTWEESEKYDAEKQAYFKKREEKQAQLDTLFEQSQKAMDSGDTETFNKLNTQRNKLSDELSSMSLDSINNKYEAIGQARIKKMQSQGANADLSVFRTFRTNTDSVTSSGGTDTKPDSTNASASVTSQASGSITSTTQNTEVQGSSSGGSPGSKAAAEFSKKYNLGTRSTGSCAKYVRSYLMASGYPLSGWPIAAADYINFLPKYGFTPVQGRATQISPEVGDISITRRFGNHKYGHIAIWNGSNWISDFKQNSVSIYRDVNAFGGPDANITILRDTSGQNPSQELVNQQLSNMDKSFKVALGGGGAKGAVYSLASGVSNAVTNTAGVISSGVSGAKTFASEHSFNTRKSLAQMYTESNSSTSFRSSSTPSSVSSSIPKETKADIKPASKTVAPVPKAVPKSVSYETPHRGQYDTETMTDFSNLGDNFGKSNYSLASGDSKSAGSAGSAGSKSNVQTNNASPVTPVVITKNSSPSDYSWTSKNSFKIARMFGLDGISDYEILNEGTESDFLQSYGMSKSQAIQSVGLNNTVQTKVASNVKTKDVIPAINKTQINNTNIQTKTKETSNKDLTDSFVLS